MIFCGTLKVLLLNIENPLKNHHNQKLAQSISGIVVDYVVVPAKLTYSINTFESRINSAQSP
jgi:hypothetical protein